jgi:hypothetical protein
MPSFRYAVAVSTRDSLPAFSGSFTVSDSETVPSWLLSCSTGTAGAPGSDVFARWLPSLGMLDGSTRLPHHEALASYIAAPTPDSLASLLRLSVACLAASSSSKVPFFDLSAGPDGRPATLRVGTYEDAGSGGIIRSVVVTSASEEELPSLVAELRVVENSFPVGSDNF